MFNFLKKTVDKALGKFKRDIEEKAELVEEQAEETEKPPKADPPKKTEAPSEATKEQAEPEKKETVRKEPQAGEKAKPPVSAPQQKSTEKEEHQEKKTEEPAATPVRKETVSPAPERETKQKKGLFGLLREKVTKIQLSEDKFNDLFWDLEVALLENNVALEVIEKIKYDLKEELTNKPLSRKNIQDIIAQTLKQSIQELFAVATFDLVELAKEKKPLVIAVIGVNGSGKTTTLAKLVHLFEKNNLHCVVAASDTFRAAAIQQLEAHTQKLGVKLIKNDYKSDPAAVAFDAIEHAKAKKLDVVLIDTAGRLHSNNNLMEELKKVIRVGKPDLKLFVGESITGNDCVEQAKVFDELVGIDAIILSKADVDEKGGAALSVSYVTKKPILYLGTGQTYDDLEAFDKKTIMERLGL